MESTLILLLISKRIGRRDSGGASFADGALLGPGRGGDRWSKRPPGNHALAFLDGQFPIGGLVADGVHRPGRPSDHDSIGPRGGTETEVKARIAGGQITAPSADFVGLHQAAGADFDTRAAAVAIRSCADSFNANGVAVGRAHVAQQNGGTGEVGDERAEAAGIFEIGDGETATDPRDRQRGSRLESDLLKPALAEITKE